MSKYTPNKTAQEIPYGYCQCGCGQRTKIADCTNTPRGLIKGQPQKFVRGHRIHLRDVAASFWSKVDKSAGPDGCWLWLAGKVQGYGVFTVKRKMHYAHRLAYEFVIGEIPDGLSVCHHCDTPACVNPAHLFLGDTAANNHDAVSKGRHVHGEKCHTAKLTAEQVLEIRAKRAAGMTGTSLAREYGVCSSEIYMIASAQCWKHI